jgi:SAM-dependent methyltransferase
MCTPGCVEFVIEVLTDERVHGRRVLEVGSRLVESEALEGVPTIRTALERLHPTEYIGVDLATGPGVDRICAAEDLISHFGASSFDVVLTTEMLEHVRDWRRVVHNLKGVLTPGGTLVVTTRSRGFPFHGYPLDFWRYERSDLAQIFSDLTIEVLRSDLASSPGVFMLAERPPAFGENTLDDYRLYSIVRRQKARHATRVDVTVAVCLVGGKQLARAVLPRRAQRWLGSMRRFVRPPGDMPS